MIIDKVIFTCDNNPHYNGFWKSISKHYFKKLNITPHLFLLSEKQNDVELFKTDCGIVTHVPVLQNYPKIIQALIGKFYFTTTELNTTWLIGDLDLYPLQKNFFINSVKEINDDKYVHLNSNAYGEDWRNKFEGLAGYYHVAKGKTFKQELFGNLSFEEIVSQIFYSNKFGIKFYNSPASAESKAATPDWGWFCCEEMFTGSKLKNSNNLVELNFPSHFMNNRIDRSNFLYDCEKIKHGYYIDMHSPRPYESYSEEIEEILSHVQ